MKNQLKSILLISLITLISTILVIAVTNYLATGRILRYAETVEILENDIELPDIPKEDEFLIEQSKISSHLGWFPEYPGESIYYAKPRENEIKFHYRVQKNLSRTTDKSQQKESYRFFALFGGSNAFGEGLKDNEIISEQVVSEIDHVRPYNFAFRGYGPAHALVQMTELNFLQKIKEPKGVGVYLFLPYHIRRIVGPYSNLQWNYGNIPDFVVDKNNRLRFDGLFRQKKIDFYFQLFFFANPGLTQWNSFRPDKKNQVTELLILYFKEMNRHFISQFPDSKFYVFLFPALFHSGTRLVNYQSFIERLKKEKINFIYDRNLNQEVVQSLLSSEKSRQALFFDDMHFKPLLAKKIANSILKSIVSDLDD